MTDEELIKSLEMCANNGNCKDCFINPHKGNYGYCTSLAIKEALDLINRQKAEIEGLYKINKSSEEDIHELRTELLKRQNLEESFCRTINQFDKRLAKTVKAERAEAIKEFADKLIVKLDNEALTEFEMYDGYDIRDTKLAIANLVEEMTEGE